MTPEQRSYVFVQTAIGAAVVNAVINGALGWLGTIGLAQFPMSTTPGVTGDLIATAFGVSFGTCFGVRLQTRLDMAKGKIVPPPLDAMSPFYAAIVSRMPKNIWARAFALGLVSVPIFAPFALLLARILASGAPALDRGVFIAVKTAFAATEGAIVTPALLLGALLDRLNARTTS